MSAFYDLSKTPRNILNQAIVRAIVSENNGLLFDPSDLSTLYQDAAGTIPVTAVEQPVGKMLDKSGNGNHATQSVTASRPLLSARKNVLLATEALSTQSVTSIAAQYTLSFTGTGSITLSGTATGTLTGTGVNDRVSLMVTPTAGTLTLTVSGSVTKAQLELGASAGPYQRVNTATDYDTDERYFKKYLRFDGVDDHLVLPYMGLYAGGSASVVVGLKSIGVPGIYSRLLAETSSSDSNSRYILLREDLNTPSIDATIVNSSGTPLVDTAPVPQTNGESSVISVVDTGSRVSLFKNTLLNTYNNYIRSSVVSLTNATLGAQLVPTATYNAFSASQLYGIIITKSALTDAQRIKCERFLAKKAGVIL